MNSFLKISLKWALYFKLLFDEGPIFTTLYWKAGQGLKHFEKKLEKKQETLEK